MSPSPPWRNRPRSWLLVAAVAVLVAGGGVAAWVATRPSAAAASTTSTALVPVTTTTLRQTLTTTGTVAYATTDDLSFGVGGTVTGVPVTVGQQVITGQVLATIDSASLASALAQAQATLANAQAKATADSGASSTQQAADQAAITAAQAAVTQAQADLAKATLTSPITGTVSAVNLTVGEQLGSSGSGAGGPVNPAGSGAGSGSSGSGSGASGGASSSGSSSAQVEVVSTGQYVVDATVDDTQIGQVATGATAGITLPDGSVTAGTVSSVGMVATTSSGVASFPVVVTVAGSPTGLHAGSSVTVVVVTRTVPGALVVPLGAVHRSASGTTVTVDRGGNRSDRAVTTGLVSNGEVQVTSGLSAGEQVVVTTVRAATPSGSTGTTGRAGFGGGGFGGGGFGGGGFGGGGFGGGRLGGGGGFAGRGGAGAGGGGG